MQADPFQCHNLKRQFPKIPPTESKPHLPTSVFIKNSRATAARRPSISRTTQERTDNKRETPRARSTLPPSFYRFAATHTAVRLRFFLSLPPTQSHNPSRHPPQCHNSDPALETSTSPSSPSSERSDSLERKGRTQATRAPARPHHNLPFTHTSVIPLPPKKAIGRKSKILCALRHPAFIGELR